MPSIPKFAKALTKLAKAKPKIISSEMKPDEKTKKESNSKVTSSKTQGRKELLVWAKSNETDEGWITDNYLKEIRLRKRYFEKNIDKRMSWIKYLEIKEKKGIIKIVKRPETKVAKDDSDETLSELQRKNLHKKMNKDIEPALNKFKDQEKKRAKDTAKIDFFYVNIYIDNTLVRKSIAYSGKIDDRSILDYIKNNIWDKKFGKFEGFDVKILKEIFNKPKKPTEF